jgi:hypothetical protein
LALGHAFSRDQLVAEIFFQASQMDEELLDVDRAVAEALEELVGVQVLSVSDRGSYRISPPAMAMLQSGQSVEDFLSLHPAVFPVSLDPAIRQMWRLLDEVRAVRGQIGVGFEELSVRRWRQFDEVSIRFHPRMTVITGANAVGKTTLLNLLSRHFNWNAFFLSSGSDSRPDDNREGVIGHLSYLSGVETAIRVQPMEVGSQQPEMAAQQFVPGLFINSHRAISSYQPIANIPLQFGTADQALSNFASEVMNRYLGSSSGRSPLNIMKETLISAAIFGEGNSSVQPVAEARAIWEGFQHVLRSVLPDSLKFRELRVNQAELLVETGDGPFLIEAVSGGLSAIIELAWQIFLRSRQHEYFTVCIDEPENHLHPEMQKSLLPSLLEAFPGISFVVATHSPFIVTSVRESRIFSLKPGEDGVVSQEVRVSSLSSTSDRILLTVLGLDSTLPNWAEFELQSAVDAVPVHPSADDLREFRNRLESLGLSDQFPNAVESLMDGSRD